MWTAGCPGPSEKETAVSPPEQVSEPARGKRLMDVQSHPAPIAQRRRIFYGWWMVVAGLAMSLVNGALFAYGFSAYIRPLTQEFGWTRTAISGVISLSRLEGGILSPVAGFLIDRFGPRRMMLLGVRLVG